MARSLKSASASRAGSNLDTTKYAIVYPRQSTAEQVENNRYSLEGQLLLRERAICDGFPEDRVVVIQDDLGLSGRTITKRPGFTRALEMIDQGDVAAIYVEDLSRLSRDERTIDQMLIADVCERTGTRIYMGGSWYDMRDAGQRQSYKYQAVGGAEYWRTHMDKLQQARRRKAQAGKAATLVPRGYRMNRDVGTRDPERDRLVPNEPDAGFIRAFVAAVVESESIRGFFLKNSPLLWPDGSALAFGTLRNILTRPIYRGVYAWGDITVPNAHEPLITPEQAARIDAMRELNGATNRGRPSETGGQFAGLLYCSECGRKLTSGKNAKGAIYRCHVQPPYAAAGGYHLSLTAAAVDGLLLGALWKRLDGDLITGIIACLQDYKSAAMRDLDLNDRSRRGLQRKIDGLVRAIADPDLTGPARKQLLAALDEASRRLDALERQTRHAPHADAELASLLRLRNDPALLHTLPATWADEPIQWRRGFLRRFIQRVELKRGKAGDLQLLVEWADGSTSEHAYRGRAAIAGEELDLIKQLTASPEYPERRRAAWVAARLTEAGYNRTEAVVAHALRRIAKQEAHRSLKLIDSTFLEVG